MFEGNVDQFKSQSQWYESELQRDLEQFDPEKYLIGGSEEVLL